MLKYRLSVVACFCLAMLAAACSYHADPIQSMQPGGLVSKVSLGQVHVLAIKDADMRMDISQFKGPLNQRDRLGFMPGGKAESSVNVFMLEHDGKKILIDTGWGSDNNVKGRLVAQLAAQGINPSDIDFILLTHMHTDHIGGLMEQGKPVFPKAVLLAGKVENDFWLSSPGKHKDMVEAMVKAYSGRYSLFSYGDTVLPGITAMDASGHTPGHTAFMVDGGRHRMLVAGDFVHAAALQFAHPDEYPNYDMDPAKAIASRKHLMDLAQREGIAIAGMHLPFSGMGTVSKNESGGYAFTPLK